MINGIYISLSLYSEGHPCNSTETADTCLTAAGAMGIIAAGFTICAFCLYKYEFKSQPKDLTSEKTKLVAANIV